MSLVRTGNIKNLSFALEALSRINGPRSDSIYSRIAGLLEDEIAKEERALPPARPAATTSDDDIPF